MSIKSLADQCVRCGLCLPHCPTYRLGKEEPESPRGRIQMLAAFAKEELAWSTPLQTHVDQCLSCGHCERVCPIPVSYESLLIKGREALAQKKAITWWKKLFLKAIETPWTRKLLFGFVPWLKTNKLSKRDFWGFSFSLTHPTSILLFPGCTGENFGQSTFDAAQRILTHAGCTVYLPPQSWCCGALSTHEGLGEKNTERTLKNLDAFCEEKNIQHVVSFATGCGGWLKKFSGRIIDIQQFLLSHAEIVTPAISTKKIRIAVHSPCTQTNALRSVNLSYDLLSKLPNVELMRFGENTCCGAAGLYMFEHQNISQQLIQQLLTQELLENCDVIVTSNIGCQLQFQRYLKKLNKKIPVCHPIELLS